MDEQNFIEYLRVGGLAPQFNDDLYTRTAGALSDGLSTGLDRAVLLRQVLRRWSLRDGRDVGAEIAQEMANSMLPVADQVGLRRRGDMWRAQSWKPEWLPLDGLPD